jgi:CheY-like chemotaxis protein/anti-sigma regulatory factor (Ser/Thr protein kinase)
MSRILVAEDSPTQAEQIRFMLEDAGHEVAVAANGAEALAAMQERLPDLVLTDLEMPEMNGLQLVENVRQSYPGVPVILMTAFGSEEIAALALQKGAASYVPKRYLDDDILPTVTNVLAVAHGNRQYDQVLRYLAETESRYALENDVALIAPLIGQFEQELTRLRLCDQTGLIRVCVALREALVNAMEHGNLEVSSATREKDDRVYHQLVQQRRQEDRYRNRRVHVTARLTRQRAEFVIRDEGPGFDPSALPDPTDPANLEKVSGRGLLLIRTFMDEVRYNETGNEVTMVVRART